MESHSRLGTVRRILERWLPPRVRLEVFRLVALVVPSRVGPDGFLRLAAELNEAGHVRAAARCWRIVHTMAPMDTRVVANRVAFAIEAGDLREADRALQDSASGVGLSPEFLVGLAGRLAQRGEMPAAARTLERLARLPGAGRLLAQSPSIVSSALPSRIDALVDAIDAGGENRMNQLHLARLCFAFRSPQPAAALFGKASEVAVLEASDRVAMLHALCEADPAALPGIGDELRGLAKERGTDPEALGLLAKVALVAGDMKLAREVLTTAMRLRHGAVGEDVAMECLVMLDLLSELRAVSDDLPAALRERSEDRATGAPKVFLSGFGWSGSGALYDAIRGASGFCEFEGAGHDAIINEDADSEVTFIQGPGGLGTIWANAVRHGSVPWGVLWDTLNLHVAGLSSIGYAQYKCVAATRNHLERYGRDYARPFARFMEEYVKIRRDPAPGALHAQLLHATESLCALLLQKSGGRAILFNNAIFARDAEMFEIFRERRAAIVYRDPRDVYVDRRNKDLNHWRTPGQLAAYYAQGLRRYTAYKLGRGVGDDGLREVQFERFVNDDQFRARVREWLLGGMTSVSGTRYFNPEISRRNIGIHVGALTSTEQQQLQDGLEECRGLDRISGASWRADV